MALLCQQFALASNQAFRDRIYVSMMTAAIAIQGESKTLSDSAHGKRQALATAVLSNPLAYLERFVVGCAAITAAGSPETDLSSPVVITSSTNANPCVVLTPVAHGLVVGDTVVITGHATNTAINNSSGGTPSAWPVTAIPDTTHFTVPVSANGAGTGGLVVRQPSDTTIANFGPFSQWSDFAGVIAGE